MQLILYKTDLGIVLNNSLNEKSKYNLPIIFLFL